MRGHIVHHHMLPDGTCRLGSIFVSLFVGLARLCEYFFFVAIPGCFCFHSELDSRRITAVLVDHNSNVLESVFCLVTKQQLLSTIHQRAQVDELPYKALAARVSSDSCTIY